VKTESSNDAKAFVYTLFAPRRPAVCSAIEVGHRLGEVLKRLLLNAGIPRAEPRERRSGLGELAALLGEPWCRLSPVLPVLVLLDGEVPDEASVCAVFE
jgi:hypothetical protein